MKAGEFPGIKSKNVRGTLKGGRKKVCFRESFSKNCQRLLRGGKTLKRNALHLGLFLEKVAEENREKNWDECT